MKDANNILRHFCSRYVDYVGNANGVISVLNFVPSYLRRIYPEANYLAAYPTDWFVHDRATIEDMLQEMNDTGAAYGVCLFRFYYHGSHLVGYRVGRREEGQETLAYFGENPTSFGGNAGVYIAVLASYVEPRYSTPRNPFFHLLDCTLHFRMTRLLGDRSWALPITPAFEATMQVHDNGARLEDAS